MTCSSSKQLKDGAFPRLILDRCQYISGLFDNRENKNKKSEVTVRCVILSCLDDSETLRDCSRINLVLGYIEMNIDKIQIICLPHINFRTVVPLTPETDIKTKQHEIKSLTEMVRDMACRSVIICKPLEDFHFVFNEVISMKSTSHVPVLADFVFKNETLVGFAGFITAIIYRLSQDNYPLSKSDCLLLLSSNAMNVMVPLEHCSTLVSYTILYIYEFWRVCTCRVLQHVHLLHDNYKI